MVVALAGLIFGCGSGTPDGPSLEDPDPQLRKDALYAMNPQAVRDQLDQVMALATTDPEPTVKRLALGLLGPSEDPRVVPILRAALMNWEDTSEQLTAATALGNVRHIDACKVMVEATVIWPSERDPVLSGLLSSLAASDPVCNDEMRARKRERPDRIGGVLLKISRSR